MEELSEEEVTGRVAKLAALMLQLESELEVLSGGGGSVAQGSCARGAGEGASKQQHGVGVGGRPQAYSAPTTPTKTREGVKATTKKRRGWWSWLVGVPIERTSHGIVV